jgi:hypothetical protein
MSRKWSFKLYQQAFSYELEGNFTTYSKSTDTSVLKTYNKYVWQQKHGACKIIRHLPANSIIYVFHHPVKHLAKMQVRVSRHLFSKIPMQYLYQDIFSYLQLTYLKHNKSDSLLVDYKICNWSVSITLESCVDCMAEFFWNISKLKS